MRRITIFVGMLFLIIFSLQAQQQRASVSGRVTDAATGEALQGAHIYLPLYKQGQSSDEEGRFKLLLPKRKSFEVTISFVGYTTRRLTLHLENDTVLNIRMRQDNRLADVNIYGSKHDFGVQNSQMSAIEMPIAQIENIPALFGEVDVLKALQRLPGVQASNDGQAGIYVRGGNYDQNQITMDGATLYNAEHLKGFVSAINADVVDNVVFYKGAFPARYGGQLSSVVDIGIREGDMQQYHGEVNLGMLSSKIHLEGPIWKNRTSFNLAARASYFDWIVQPLLKEVSNKKGTMTPYADLNYYDLTAKLTHRFNEKHKLSAFFYYGKDVNNQAPAGSGIKNSYVNQDYEVNPEPQDLNVQESKLSNGTENDWSNVASTLYWSYRPTERLAIHTNLNYSQYKYRLKQFNYSYSKKTVEKTDGTTELKYLQENSSSSESLSGIQEFSASTLFQYHPGEKHYWRWGGKLSQQYFNPRVRLHQTRFYQTQTSLSESRLDTLVNNSKERLTTAALFVEDNWILNKHWKANIGLRYALFHVPHKTYHSLEPRLSLRWLFRKDMALKISYAHMAQGVHLLSNSNLVMPSDVWVSITEQVPLMKSDQYAIGYNYEIANNIELSVEGYYKRMKNLLEYQEGSSYLSNGEKGWQNMVSLGEGEAYGVELYAEKKSGRTTGWVSYTWSKSLRLFNRPGEELNGGRTFYSGSDRRHNFSAVVVHKLNKHWDVSAAWTYQSGKRGTLPITTFMSGIEYDFDAYWEGSYNSSNLCGVSFIHGNFEKSPSPDLPDHIYKFFPMSSYKERNGYVLPAIHRLDVSMNCHMNGKLFGRSIESTLSFSIYNLYNRLNISNVYWGYDKNKVVLKGVCLLPFMPSVSYSLKF